MEKPNSSTPKRPGLAALRRYWYAPVALAVVVLLFLTGSWYGHRKAAGSKTGSRRILHYVDPMNPAHTSPEPGLAPCGMKMEPVYADEAGQEAPPGLPPGSVKITPAKQQIIGVRVGEVKKSPYTYILRTVGKVAADETRLYQVNAISDGWILKVFDNSTGSLVRRDEPLATYFSNRSDLPSALLAYYAAVDLANNLKQAQHANRLGTKDLLESQRMAAEITLLNMGVNRQQMQDLARDRKLTQEIFIYAPTTGFILARKVSPGQTFKAGDELYRLADFSRVWILADLFEKEAKYIRPGEKVKVGFPQEEESRWATVSEILPEFDPATQTLKVRLEIDNPDFILRPGMFMDVEFPIKMPPTINIPADAILDSGTQKLVFVDRGKGFFEPRRVKTGWRLGDRVQILEGLKSGERIATSGNFLIDSESRMKLAAAGFYGKVGQDPVCGNHLDETKARSAGHFSQYQGQTFYFCSEACKEKFNLTPERYLAKSKEAPAPKPPTISQKPSPAPAAPPRLSSPPPPKMAASRARDPVCGMELDPETARKAGLNSEFQGKTYYFCSPACKEQFAGAPASFLAQTKDAPASESHGAAPQQKTHPGAPSPQAHSSAAPAGDHRLVDPACGLSIAPETARKAGLTSIFQGKTYYFCTPGCKQRFDNDPQHYLSGAAAVPIVPPVPYRGTETKFQDPYAPYIFRQKVIRSRTQWASPGQDQTLSPIFQGLSGGQAPGTPPGPAAPLPPGQHPGMAGPPPEMPQGHSHSLAPGAAALPPPATARPRPRRMVPPASPGLSRTGPQDHHPQAATPAVPPPAPAPAPPAPPGGEHHHD